ncbi:hypothetical protein VM1G_06540 [Cytospora mali]|uniref:C2H2-type domain-containing protein n=1 Tax=Cytospora mali TaxID=578113 RepID=A0A194W273_CYTMA|nr:hypothetical protein VM1G_06540 [Valsa mali]
MERIREASAKELFPIILTLCDMDEGIMKRVMSHMQLLKNRNTLNNESPDATEHVRQMTETDLRAIVFTICEDDVAIKDRVLDYLRLLEISQWANDYYGLGNSGNSLSDSNSDSGDSETSDTSRHTENFLFCGHCKEVFNEDSNHIQACRRHTDDLERSSESGTFFWPCCLRPASEPGCIEGYHEELE